MPALGNQTFQGTGLTNDVIRRLDDMLKRLSSAGDQLNSLSQSALTKAEASALYGPAAVQKILATPGTVLNITNATGVTGTSQPTLFGTHAQRVSSLNAPSKYAAGTLFVETDREAIYQIQSGAWHYIGGAILTLTTLASRPADLGANDTGFPIYAKDYTVEEYWNGAGWVYAGGEAFGTFGILAALAAILTASEVGFLAGETTYAHRYRWTGSTWQFATGDPGSGFYVFGPQPQGGVWYALDGASHVCSKGDGTTVNVNTPNWNGTVAIAMGGATNLTVTAASVPTWQAGAKTDTENVHTHTVVNNSPLGTGAPNSAVAAQTTSAGSAHAHNLSNANAKLNVPSVANGGLPAFFQFLGWLRA